MSGVREALEGLAERLNDLEEWNRGMVRFDVPKGYVKEAREHLQTVDEFVDGIEKIATLCTGLSEMTTDNYKKEIARLEGALKKAGQLGNEAVRKLCSLKPPSAAVAAAAKEFCDVQDLVKQTLEEER